MPRGYVRSLFVALGVVVSTGCGESTPSRAEAASVVAASFEGRRASQDSIVRSSPGYVVDSIHSIEEDLRRFRADLGDSVAAFAFGAPSREALVRSFVRAIEQNDTTALARLVVNRREFAYLVYPTSPNTRPPYRQSPQIVWLQRSAVTNKGASRLLERFGGRPMGYAGYTCPTPAVLQGHNTIWETCLLRRSVGDGDTASVRLFGPIVARKGRYKFLSLVNGL